MCSQGGKDHLFIRDEMDIMDYPAGIVETVLRVKKKWQLHLDHVVSLQAGKVAAEERNWKQCASKKADGRFGGLIKVSRRQFPGEGGGVLLGILGGGVLRSSSNPYPISHQKM